MKTSKFLFLFLWAILIISCHSDDEIFPSEDVSQKTEFYDDSIIVSKKTAERVAELFKKRNNGSLGLKSTTTSIENISTFYNEDGTPAMYIINYGNNNGFVIVSATKNYEPILAFSDGGNFDLENKSMPLGIAEWLVYGKQIIRKQIEEQCVDSLIRFHEAWKMYEESVIKDNNKLKYGTGNDEFNSVVFQLVQEWRNKDYQFEEFDPYNSNIPNEIYNMIMGSTLDYNPSIAFIITEYESDYENVGPLLSTKWNQIEPFNRLTPSNYPTGCVPTAMAQVLNYHRWPNNYNWNLMKNIYNNSGITEEEKNEVAKLMLAAGKSVKTDYGKDGSGAHTSDVPSALKNDFGYSSSVKYSDYNFSTVVQEIRTRRPVILNGKRDSFLGIILSNGHAWVCDGYASTNCIKRTTAVIINGAFGPVEVKYIPIDNWEYVYYTSYLHMNWGWGGSYDAWFNPFNFGFTNNDGEYINYKYGQGMVVNIYPNK